MILKVDISELSKTKWHEYALRFVFGGGMTVIAGIIAKHYGPGVGGLFLAFPAIAPAAATLMDQHAKEKKQRAGFEGHTRGRKIAALDMYGTLWGTAGLLAFALVVWQMGPSHRAWIVLLLAMLAWVLVGCSVWELRRVFKRRRAAHQRPALQPASSQHHQR